MDSLLGRTLDIINQANKQIIQFPFSQVNKVILFHLENGFYDLGQKQLLLYGLGISNLIQK